jgi:hypothetical protein
MNAKNWDGLSPDFWDGLSGVRVGCAPPSRMSELQERSSSAKRGGKTC